MDSTAQHPIPSPIELEVRRIRALVKSRQLAEGLQAAEELATRVPKNRDVLYLMAMSQRQLGRIPEALATLGERLGATSPGIQPPVPGRSAAIVYAALGARSAGDSMPFFEP